MAQANSNETEGRGPQKGLVLVVDDDSRTQRLEKVVLEEEGFPVETVGSGEEALAIFDTISPVLVLLDVNMPGIDGFTTCQRIREISQVPIIMVTGENRDEDKVRGLELGADDYVTKPFAIAELAARVKAVLHRYDGGVIPEISDLDRKIAALSPGFIAKVMVGDPDEDTLCAAPAVSVSKTVSPEIVYVDDADQTFLYTIQIVNDGSAAVFIKETKDLLHDSFRYLPLPITSPEADDDCVDTAPSSVKSKNAKKDKPAFTEIKWKFPKDDPLALAAGESWCIQFEAEATRLERLPAGYYANEVEVRFDKTRLLIEPPPPYLTMMRQCGRTHTR